LICEFPARITYYDLDARGRPKISALLRYAHIAADINANQIGAGYEILKKYSMGFVLQRFAFEAKRMPLYEENVIIRTWPGSVEKGIYLRHGNMLSDENENLLEWTSLWVLFDLNERKILRPSALPVSIEGLGALGVTAQPKKIETSGDTGELISVHSHTVRYNELDTYGHMNNTHYGDMVENAVNHRGLDGEAFEWKRAQINYLSELRFGDEVEISCEKQNAALRISGAAGDKKIFSALLE